MCGIVGVISRGLVERRDVLAMRDALVHRGPDDAGLVETECGTLGHTRLSILDPSVLGHQPMATPDGRFTIVYNGELYNDRELREELSGYGVEFASRCDTETVLHAVARWGLGARHRLRGMYAMVILDARERVCVLARDPMGIKPMYMARLNGGRGGVAFSSELQSLLAHRGLDAQPDRVTMSAYMTTIRPEFGRRTLFEGVESLEPGEWALYSAESERFVERVSCWDSGSGGLSDGADARCTGDAQEARQVIVDSVVSHLRTDVPMCSLLSGGLDSSIIAKVAYEQLGELRTFCAGARVPGFEDDFQVAARMAKELGTDHTEIEVEGSRFLNRWRSMVHSTGVPLSTPNEVAIYEVCAGLRNSGYTVALSGEGADELFGGYESPMLQAQNFVDHIPSSDLVGGLFHLQSNAWVREDLKSVVMQDDWYSRIDEDRELRAWYSGVFGQLRDESDDSMQAHLKFHRRKNLPNLLRRLDSASMMSSVEGRTPFADQLVAQYAESIPMNRKFVGGVGDNRTKIVLREAFADVLPAEVLSRPKASFPLPFQQWIGAAGDVLKRSGFAQSYFRWEAVEAVAGDIQKNWNLAWPMMNLAMWGERWWGDEGVIEEVFEEAGATADRSSQNHQSLV